MKWSPFVNIRRSLTAQARLKTIELSNGTAEKPLRVFFVRGSCKKKTDYSSPRSKQGHGNVATLPRVAGLMACSRCCTLAQPQGLVSAHRFYVHHHYLLRRGLASATRWWGRTQAWLPSAPAARVKSCPPQQRLIAYGLLVCLRGIRFSAPRPHCRLMDRAHQGAAQRRQEGAGLLPGARRRPAVWQAALPCGCDVNI